MVSEEVRGRHVGICVESMVVLRVIKELPLVHVAALVVLGHADIEVFDPAQLAVDVSLFGHA